jgi:transcriptional regulator with XRE-family HTH domain
MDRIGRRHPIRFFLAEWREHRHLDQDALAERMETTKATISKLENGKMQMTGKWMATAANALGIDPEDLLHHPDKPTPNELLRNATDEQRRLAVDMLKVITGGARSGT